MGATINQTASESLRRRTPLPRPSPRDMNVLLTRRRRRPPILDFRLSRRDAIIDTQRRRKIPSVRRTIAVAAAFLAVACDATPAYPSAAAARIERKISAPLPFSSDAPLPESSRHRIVRPPRLSPTVPSAFAVESSSTLFSSSYRSFRRLKSSSFSSSSSSSALSAARFVRPLVEAGYAPAVSEYESGALSSKPLLLYLPGFDGTLVAPFIQFPELGTEFDVRGMEVPMNDRSTFAELAEAVTEYVLAELGGGEPASSDRPLYLVGESFGGILALEVSRSILGSKGAGRNLRGLVLVNPATCYDRSVLASRGPEVAALPPWRYPFGVMGLFPLFTDEHSLPQLWMILGSEGLPSVIDTAAREAYMGRTALSLPSKVKFMPRDTLRWRLMEWLTRGCAEINATMDGGGGGGGRGGGGDGSGLGRGFLEDLPVLILAGERDRTLPSVSEAERLASSGVLRNVKVVVVDGAGHASTLGSRVDLAAEMRATFPELRARGGRMAMKAEAATGAGTKSFGMEPRYDGAWIGLNPLKYWSEEYYREPRSGA